MDWKFWEAETSLLGVYMYMVQGIKILSFRRYVRVRRGLLCACVDAAWAFA